MALLPVVDLTLDETGRGFSGKQHDEGPAEGSEHRKRHRDDDVWPTRDELVDTQARDRARKDIGRAEDRERRRRR
jgi:hypothetical protein